MFLEVLADRSFSEDVQTEFFERITRTDERKWLSCISAFANADGGILYIGAKDNRITGFDRKTARSLNALL